MSINDGPLSVSGAEDFLDGLGLPWEWDFDPDNIRYMSDIIKGPSIGILNIGCPAPYFEQELAGVCGIDTGSGVIFGRHLPPSIGGFVIIPTYTFRALISFSEEIAIDNDFDIACGAIKTHFRAIAGPHSFCSDCIDCPISLLRIRTKDIIHTALMNRLSGMGGYDD